MGPPRLPSQRRTPSHRTTNHQPKNLKRWGILVFDTPQRFGGPQGATTKFVTTMCVAASEYGMNIDRYPVITFGNFNAPQNAVHRACEELFTKVEREKGGPPEMLMFFVKGKSPIMYEHIKQWCDTIKGVQSQAVDGGNVISKGHDRAFHANLLLKMNTKLGGTTVTLQTPLTTEKVPTVRVFSDELT
jgi:hypothetical protein